MAIAAQKLLPQKTGGAMVPINKSAITKITPIGVKKPADADPAEGEEKDTLVVIKERCIEIDTLLKGSLALDKIRADQSRKKSEKKERAEGEKELEKSDNKDEKKGKGLKLPKISFFDRIKNFIKNVILGFIVTRLIKFAPQIAKVLSFLAPIGKFIFAVGAKLLEGLVNFVDFGYKIYDSGRKFIGDKLGDEALANFDKLSGAINTMLNLALIAAMATMGGRQRGPRRPKRPKRPRRFNPKDIKNRAKNIRKIRNKRRLQQVTRRLAPVVDAGRSVSQRGRTAVTNVVQSKPVTNVVQSKPVQNLARKGGGLFDRIANNRFVKGATDFSKSIYKGAVGTTNFIGGLGKKFGSSITNAYDGMKDLAKKRYDDVIKAKDFLSNKFKQGTQALGNAVKGLSEKAKEAFVKKIIEPLQPIFQPLLEKVKSLGKKFGDVLKKIPGYDKVSGVLKKIGASSSDGLMKKLGAKAIPVLGGIVNLLFAYDRIAQGDTFGGLLEGISGAFDLSTVFGFPGAPVSMVIDTYMLARDFIPQIQEGEEAVINAAGLGGLKSQMDNMAKKLPDLSTIAKFIVGGDPNKPLVGNKTEKGETSGTTKSNLGSTPNTNTNTASGNSNVKVGGSNVVAIGKDLANKGFTVAEHPDFTKDTSGGAYTPGEGSVSNVHKGRGHYESRAIDVTNFKGGDPGYKQSYLPVLNSLENNSAIKMLIHDTWGFYKDGGKSGPGSYGHPEHMHIEVKDEGGFIGKGLFKNKGGVEFVLDHDTTKALEQTLPGFLNAINKADGKSVMDVLGKYASYDMPEVIPVPIPQPIQNAASDAYGKAKSAVTNIVVSGKEAFNDILYMR